MNRTYLLRVVVRVAAVVALGLAGLSIAGASFAQPDDIIWMSGQSHVAVAGHTLGR